MQMEASEQSVSAVFSWRSAILCVTSPLTRALSTSSMQLKTILFLLVWGLFNHPQIYTQHSGFPTCARSLLLYDILARSRVIRFPIVFALLPLRKRRSLREHIGSVNTFDVYCKSFYNYSYCCHHISQVLPKTCRMIKGLVCLFVVSTGSRCVNVQNR